MTSPADDPILALADEFTDRMHRADPFSASEFGVAEYDGQLPDVTRAGEDALVADLRGLQRRAEVLAASEPGPAGDEPTAADRRLVLAVLRSKLVTTLLDVQARAIEYTVTALPLSGPPVLMAVCARQTLPTEQSGADYLSRLRGSGDWIDETISRLRDGVRAGRTPVAALAEVGVQWAHGALAAPVPAAVRTPAAGVDWDGSGRWRAEVDRVGAEIVRPAIQRWRDVVADELLPIARGDAQAGIGALPGGAEDYERAIEVHTTLSFSAGDLHEIGRARIAELHAQARGLGAELGLDDLAAVLEAFRAGRGSDAAAAMEQSRQAIRRAEARVDTAFGPPVAPPCAVAAMPDTVAETGMAPHYTLPRADGSRPGTYWFNTKTPTVGTGWDLEAVAFHEAVPGHHLQLARAQSTAGLPRLLTQTLITVHAEGWGLYAERLAGELDLYSSVEQQIGSVFMELHRACRLVVDTGIHAFGWGRQQAYAFLAEHMPVPEPFLRAETDRYIAWPGQALAYLVGQREVLRLREYARTSLGPGFELSGFHGAVLDHGSIPMPALATAVQQWIDSV
jgi:uncharacterized protein (DUF885 family)